MQQITIRFSLGAALLAVGGPVLAQSTATRIEDGTLQEVTISAEHAKSISGLIQHEDATKSRTTVTQEYFATQPAGQTVIQSLNLVPGVNFTNSYPRAKYGTRTPKLPAELYGFDGALGFQVVEGLALYGTASYNHSEVKRDVPFSATVMIPTSGKKVVETPDRTYGGRAEYKIAGLTLGLQGKYVARRFSTDVNDQAAPSYTVFDADVRYEFQLWGKTTFVQLNAVNLTDKDYYGSVATSRFWADTTKPYGNSPL